MEGRIFVVAKRLAVPELAKNGAILRVAPVRQRLEAGDEARDLLLPVVKSRGRGDDEEGPPDVVDFGEVGHERD